MKRGFSPSQCALVLLPRALAGVLYLLFLPPGSPLAANGAPRRTPAARSKSLLPGCFLFTQQKQRSGRTWRLESNPEPLCLAGILFVFSLLRRNLAGPDSDVNGMTKRGHCLLQFKLRSGAPRPGPPQCMRPQGADCGTWSGTRTLEESFPLLAV